MHLVYYAFDLLNIGGWNVSGLSLLERKTLLEPLVVGKLRLQYNGHDTGDGELILAHAGEFGFEAVVSKTIDAPYAPGNRGLWRKAKALNRQEFMVRQTTLMFAVSSCRREYSFARDRAFQIDRR